MPFRHPVLMRGLWLVLPIVWMLATSSPAELLSADKTRQAAENWPVYMGLEEEGRKASEILPIPDLDAGTVYHVSFEGGGWALAAGDDLLLPVYAYSPTGDYPVGDNPAKTALYAMINRSIEARQVIVGEALTEMIAGTDQVWLEVLSGARPKTPPDKVDQLMSSNWYQSGPYNEDCPASGGICGGESGDNPDECPTGCVATAMSQLMYYWKHPASYDWEDMLDQVWLTSPQTAIDAVAQLCHEAGLAVSMDYCDEFLCKSGAFSEDVPGVMNSTFDYYADANYEEANIADLIGDLTFLRPVYVREEGVHAWVCDGYDQTGGTTELHWRMGWDGMNDIWATVDAIPGPPNSGIPLMTYTHHIRYIAPRYEVMFVGSSDPGDGSPNNPFGSVEEAVAKALNGTTLIFRAGSDNAVSTADLIIDSDVKELTLKGIDVTIRRAK